MAPREWNRRQATGVLSSNKIYRWEVVAMRYVVLWLAGVPIVGIIALRLLGFI